MKDAHLLVSEDALTILEQVEGAMAYLDTLATRADEKTFIMQENTVRMATLAR